MFKTTYVISLTTERKRRSHIQQEFTQLGLAFNFFDAIDKVNALDIANQQKLDYLKDSITLGELGCFMSHFLLWKKLIDENLPYMVIFEDDVILSPNIVSFFHVLDDIMHNFDVIKLETMLTPSLYKHPAITYAQLQFLAMKSEHMGLAGYVITQKMAKELITTIQNTCIVKPIDHYVFRDLINLKSDLKIYQVTPALVIQEDVLNSTQSILTSSLEHERRLRMNGVKAKMKGVDKLKRELNRVREQLTVNKLKIVYRKILFNRKAMIVPFDGS